MLRHHIRLRRRPACLSGCRPRPFRGGHSGESPSNHGGIGPAGCQGFTAGDGRSGRQDFRYSRGAGSQTGGRRRAASGHWSCPAVWLPACLVARMIAGERFLFRGRTVWKLDYGEEYVKRSHQGGMKRKRFPFSFIRFPSLYILWTKNNKSSRNRFRSPPLRETIG